MQDLHEVKAEVLVMGGGLAGPGPIYFDLTSITPREYELSPKTIPWNFMLMGKESRGLHYRED